MKQFRGIFSFLNNNNIREQKYRPGHPIRWWWAYWCHQQKLSSYGLPVVRMLYPLSCPHNFQVFSTPKIYEEKKTFSLVLSIWENHCIRCSYYAMLSIRHWILGSWHFALLLIFLIFWKTGKIDVVNGNLVKMQTISMTNTDYKSKLGKSEFLNASSLLGWHQRSNYQPTNANKTLKLYKQHTHLK